MNDSVNLHKLYLAPKVYNVYLNRDNYYNKPII